MSAQGAAARAARWMAGAGLAGLLALSGAPALAQDAVPDFRPVTDAMIQHPDAADWLSFRRTLNAWGYSPLDQIDASNVKGLKEAWSRPLEGFMIEATPLVHDGVMYLPLPDDRIVAMDAATGKTVWDFALTRFSQANVMTTVTGLVFSGADQDFYALDARTGKLLWRFTGGRNGGGPITYTAGGKQFIAAPIGSAIVAFGL